MSAGQRTPDWLPMAAQLAVIGGLFAGLVIAAVFRG